MILQTFLVAASAAILAADFFGGLPRVAPFSGEDVLVASEIPFVLVKVVTSCLIIVWPRFEAEEALLLLLFPFLFDEELDCDDWDEGAAEDAWDPFLLPALLDCGDGFLDFLLDITGVLSESFSLLSLNILFANADDFSLLLWFYGNEINIKIRQN